MVEAIKGAKASDQLRTLAQAFVALAPQLNVEDAHILSDAILKAMQDGISVQRTAELFVSLVRRLPWPERLNLFVAALKYPTVYGDSQSVVIMPIKEYLEANGTKPPNDTWAIIEWLKSQQGIDLTIPPQRTKAAAR